MNPFFKAVPGLVFIHGGYSGQFQAFFPDGFKLVEVGGIGLVFFQPLFHPCVFFRWQFTQQVAYQQFIVNMVE
jgi:hypothetical protein